MTLIVDNPQRIVSIDATEPLEKVVAACFQTRLLVVFRNYLTKLITVIAVKEGTHDYLFSQLFKIKIATCLAVNLLMLISRQLNYQRLVAF